MLPALRPFLDDIARRPLLRQAATVAGGTAAAQAVTLAAAPLLTRLYGPEVFGLQGVFVSIVGLLAVVAALGYPMAVVLPARDADALGLVRLSLALGAATSAATALALALGGDVLLRLLQAEALRPLAWLLPLAMFGSVLAAVLTHWLSRRRAFAFSARWTLAGSLLSNGGKLAFGAVHPGPAALIGSHAGAALLAALAGAWRWRARDPGVHDGPPAPWRRLAHAHADFARWRTPQNLVNAASQGLPVLLLAAGAGAAAAGQYALAVAVLAVPATLIGGAVGQVFYPRISDAVRGGEDVRALILRATRAMAAAGALPFALVALAGPALFAFVFGDAWADAGRYGRWLAAWMFLQCVNIPAVAAVPALGLQRGLLVYELFSTGAKLLALWWGLAVLGDDLAAVALYCAAGVAAYVWLIAWIVARAGRLPEPRR